jgi:hypothetical protein
MRVRRLPLPSMGEIDTSAPHPARRYNYWLGGKELRL